jgi:hypothetical protein
MSFLPNQALNKETSNYDLVLFYAFENSPTGTYRARAGPCHFSEKYFNRPIAGMMFLNLRYLSPVLNISDSLLYEKLNQNQKITIQHEFMHVLGFSKVCFRNYITPDGKNASAIFRKDNQTYISSLTVRKYAREYYNCSKLPGMVLETSGGDGTYGSHWSRSAIYNELMTGSAIYDYRVLTKFTLKLLEDTGWYLPDYNYTQKTIWGKNKGCSFVSPQCGTFKEFCTTNNSLSCNYNNEFISQCKNDGLSKCNYYVGVQNCSESRNSSPNVEEFVKNITILQPLSSFTSQSHCVMSKFNLTSFIPSCFNTLCDRTSRSLMIAIFDNKTATYYNFICKEDEGDRIKSKMTSYGNMTIICPYYSRVCFEEDDSVSYVNDVVFTSGSWTKLSKLNIMIVIIFMFFII